MKGTFIALSAALMCLATEVESEPRFRPVGHELPPSSFDDLPPLPDRPSEQRGFDHRTAVPDDDEEYDGDEVPPHPATYMEGGDDGKLHPAGHQFGIAEGRTVAPEYANFGKKNPSENADAPPPVPEGQCPYAALGVTPTSSMAALKAALEEKTKGVDLTEYNNRRDANGCFHPDDDAVASSAEQTQEELLAEMKQAEEREKNGGDDVPEDPASAIASEYHLSREVAEALSAYEFLSDAVERKKYNRMYGYGEWEE